MAMLRISNTIYSFSLCDLYKIQHRKMDRVLVKLELKSLLSVVSATRRRSLTGLNNAVHVQTYVLKAKCLFPYSDFGHDERLDFTKRR